MESLALTYNSIGNEIKATQLCITGLKIARQNHLVLREGILLTIQGFIQNNEGNYSDAMASY
jgi:hypothetical protein